MLVLGRKLGERIVIGADVEVVVCWIGDGQVRLGIDAPTEVPIRRGELSAAPPGGTDRAETHELQLREKPTST